MYGCVTKCDEPTKRSIGDRLRKVLWSYSTTNHNVINKGRK
jgi:hypothetical protein